MTTVTDAIAATLRARTVEKAEDVVRDMIPLVRDELERNSTQRLFEAPYAADNAFVLSLGARAAIFDLAHDERLPMSSFNEYAQYMKLAAMVRRPVSTYDRPVNQHMAQVAEAENPTRTAFTILRTEKHLTDAVAASVLEAAFPLAVAGLDEETRNFLYSLASDRGVSVMEVATAYVELAELVTAIRLVRAEGE